MPAEHHHHPFDHLGRAVLARTSRGTIDLELLVPAAGPATKHRDVGKRAKVIDVQVRDENLVELVECETGRVYRIANPQVNNGN